MPIRKIWANPSCIITTARSALAEGSREQRAKVSILKKFSSRDRYFSDRREDTKKGGLDQEQLEIKTKPHIFKEVYPTNPYRDLKQKCLKKHP